MAFSKLAPSSPKKTKITREGSDEQIAIWDALVQTKSHVVVNAGPGVGKTYTCINGFQVLLDNGYQGRAAFCAFNKSIAEELAKRVPNGVACSTLHSLGYKMVMQTFGKVKVDSYKLANTIARAAGCESFRAVNYNVRVGLEKLVPLCKSFLLSGEDREELSELCENYNIELNGSRDRVFKLVPEVLKLCKDEIRVIDFDDMVWFPVVHNMDAIKLDLLVVDEAQDLNRVQQELVWKSASRIMLVGDKRQSIYGFRGSDAAAIESFSFRLKNSDRGVVELPLLVSRRCPKTHIEMAQLLVPEVQALPKAIDGKIFQSTLQQAVNEMSSGDLVMSRCNAPLISCAYQLLRLNKRVQIQGRDFGKGLESLVKRVCDISKLDHATCSIPDFTLSLSTYETREIDRIMSENKQAEKKLANLEDKILCIRFLCEGLKDVSEILERLDSLFSDKEGTDFIRLSSVHRAKGLEADRTYILEPEKFPHPMAKQPWEKVQELNCLFVAITRSKDTLTFIGGLPRPLSSYATSITRRQADKATEVHEEEQDRGEVSVLSESTRLGSFNDVPRAPDETRTTPTKEASKGNQETRGDERKAGSKAPANAERGTKKSRAGSDWFNKKPKKG